MEIQHLTAFVVASVLLILAPGIDMALVTRQVVLHGRRSGFATSAGVVTGALTQAGLAALGLSAVLTTSTTAFTVVKVVGACYLIVIGFQTLRATRRRSTHERPPPDVRARMTIDGSMTARRAYMLGLTSNLTNPKTAIFFLTFLPQFVAPGASAQLTTAVLGLLFNVMAAIWWIGYVMVLGSLAAILSRPVVSRWFERLTGGVLIALGVRLILER